MDSGPTNNILSAEAIVRRTDECLKEMKIQSTEHTNSRPLVLIILGRPGTGKSSFFEDVARVSGHSQESLDTVTQVFALAKFTIRNKVHFIMDTPGFDPDHQEAIFREIVRGIQAVLPLARIAGFLYLTCVNQPRFDSFDRKVLRIIRAMSGDNYIPCLTFITTFWSARGAAQESQFNSQLGKLKREWETAFGTQRLHCYQHGRGYNTQGEVTESFIDWYSETGRSEIAQHARDMIENYYCGSHASAHQDSKIIQELQSGIPIHQTDAGRVLGMRPPPSSTTPLQMSNEQNRSGNDQQSSSASSSGGERGREDSPDVGSQGTRRNSQATPRSSQEETAPQTGSAPQAPGKTIGDVIIEGMSWFFRNVNLPSNGLGATFSMSSGSTGASFGGRPFPGASDPLSPVDVMKFLGLDHSPEGRMRYAMENGIGGQPFSAQWGADMLEHLRQRYASWT